MVPSGFSEILERYPKREERLITVNREIRTYRASISFPPTSVYGEGRLPSMFYAMYVLIASIPPISLVSHHFSPYHIIIYLTNLLYLLLSYTSAIYNSHYYYVLY